jgi:hypothetical protein
METVKKLALGTVILICGCKPSIEDHKYTISGAHGQTYHTDKITREDDCITFEDDCGCIGTDTKTVTLCGSYTITKNNVER